MCHTHDGYPVVVTKSIQIRDVPDETHRELRARAAAAGQSLSQYLLAELERVASRPPVADVLRRAATRPVALDDEMVVAAVRAGRDRD
jgi:plasmid stability protein